MKRRPSYLSILFGLSLLGSVALILFIECVVHALHD